MSSKLQGLLRTLGLSKAKRSRRLAQRRKSLLGVSFKPLLEQLEERAVLAAGDLLISEFMANPAGNDSNLEYVELVATRAINFAVNPYSVVWTNNGTAAASGWIAGSTLTYGFNISSGSVNAGDVVYVGGSGMAPTGTKLRVIDVTTTPGDGFGNSQAVSGVLGGGGNDADAIGVFDLPVSSISDTTVPIDAIFFGSGRGAAVVSGGTAGYQLPVNDNYGGGKLQTTSFLGPDSISGQAAIATGTYNVTANSYPVARTWSTGAATATTAITLTGLNTNPTIANNLGLTLNEGATATITTARLQVTDAEQAAASLTFTATAVPANGSLRKSGTPLIVSNTFTQADIDNNLITYVHSGSETTSDSFSFTVSDGVGGSIGSTTFNFTVTPQNDSPALVVNNGLTLNEGATATITTARLQVTDAEQAAPAVIYTATAVPANGSLRKGGTPLIVSDTFTQADIDNNLITYLHNGSETTSDSFSFTVSDGVGGTLGSTTFNFTVTPQNDNPVLATNLGLTLNEAATATITTARLLVTDAEQAAASVTYTVSVVPANGSLRKSGTPLIVSDTFTQADIDNNLITYVHSGSETTSDSFSFTVSDGASGSLGSTTFAFTVSPVSDSPVVAVNTGASVVQGNGNSVTVTTARLQTTDVDNTAAQLTYTVTALPTHGTLKKSGVDLALSGTFTQADIDGGLITYVNGGTGAGLGDSVTLSVTDGTTPVAGTVFNISISFPNQSPTIGANAGLTLNEGATATITNSLLLVNDADNTAAQLTLTVATLPANGALRRSGVTLAVNDTFTQADINNSLITYVHNGGETTADSFAFTVSDGSGGSIGSTTFNITVSPQNDDPTLTVNAGLTLNEGATATIGTARLQVSDADNTAAERVFTLGTIPTRGTLFKSGSPLAVSGTFTQADIDGNLITYTHNGSQTTSDSFTFSVSDGAGGSIGSTTFNITVTPQNNAPTLSINAGLTLNEAATATITNSLLLVDDVDNTAAQLLYTVTAIPTEGVLSNNSTPLAVNDTFSQADINNNLITYVHSGSETTADSFTFTVSDGGGGSIGATTFNITVSPLNDDPVLAINAGLTLNEGATATIGATQLQVTDADNSSAQIVFTVGSIPANGELRKSGTPLAANDTFTQADLDNSLVTYVHSDSETTVDSFTFTVSDGAGGNIGSTTFNIAVTPQNDNPVLTGNAGLVLNEGATATIGTTLLQTTDGDHSAAQLFYTVTTIPTEGVLSISGTPLAANDTFTQADINANLLAYAHSGSETTPVVSRSRSAMAWGEALVRPRSALRLIP